MLAQLRRSAWNARSYGMFSIHALIGCVRKFWNARSILKIELSFFRFSTTRYLYRKFIALMFLVCIRIVRCMLTIIFILLWTLLKFFFSYRSSFEMICFVCAIQTVSWYALCLIWETIASIVLTCFDMHDFCQCQCDEIQTLNDWFLYDCTHWALTLYLAFAYSISNKFDHSDFGSVWNLFNRICLLL